MRSSKRRNDSLATIHLEELFGPISIDSRDNSLKFSYPNTVPHGKVSSLKTLGIINDDSFDDDIKPVPFSSANLSKNRRRSHEFDAKQM